MNDFNRQADILGLITLAQDNFERLEQQIDRVRVEHHKAEESIREMSPEDRHAYGVELTSVYELKDTAGNYVIGPLLAAQAQALHTIALLRAELVSEEEYQKFKSFNERLTLERNQEAIELEMTRLKTPVDSPVVRKPEEWCKELGYQILDRDGWRDGTDWEQEITQTEFLTRAHISTHRRLCNAQGPPEASSRCVRGVGHTRAIIPGEHRDDSGGTWPV